LSGPPGTVLSDARCQTTKGKRHKKHNTIIAANNHCRCARITRFIAFLLDYLLDYFNLLRNFILYKFFMNTIYTFYGMVGRFGKGVINNIRKIRFLH
jgi:hypothetical protein